MPTTSLGERMTFELGAYQKQVWSSLDEFDQVSFVERLWEKDASLWTSDQKKAEDIRERLGWLDLPRTMSNAAGECRKFAAEIASSGFTHAVLLGMGGSSLAPELFQRTFGSRKGFPKFLVLDSTDPAAVGAVESNIELGKTLFIVSSKSGTTIETHSFFLYFFDLVKKKCGEKAGRQFVAITDPGTPLVKTASDLHFRNVFLAPADVGGRYSALTYFGLVPAALMGVDIEELLKQARAMAKESQTAVTAAQNPAVLLGAVMGELAGAGRDKLTLRVSSELKGFSDWIEQLVAESTGKSGKGVLPVTDEPEADTSLYGPDRWFVFVERNEEGKDEYREEKDGLSRAGIPWVSFRLRHALDLGAAFLLWEIATAVAAARLQIDPFDEPNVTESKENSKKILENPEKYRVDNKIGLEQGRDLDAALSHFFKQIKTGDYLSFMVYGPPTDEAKKLFQPAREIILNRLRIPSTRGFGPRFLHSTGQLHKGGANNGVFLQIVYESTDTRAVPAKPYSFEVLKQAQALGDYLSLKNKGRRVVRVTLKGKWEKELERFLDLFRTILAKHPS